MAPKVLILFLLLKFEANLFSVFSLMPRKVEVGIYQKLEVSLTGLRLFAGTLSRESPSD